MKKRQVQIPVLCEDAAHRSFALGYLKKRGYSNIRIVPYPAYGGGSGKNCVLREYPNEVRAARRYRRMNQSVTYALVVVIDQDTPSQPDAFDELGKRLLDEKLPRRADDERIAIFAPRYCIETWARHLLNAGAPVDEETDYSESRFHISNDECRRAGKAFADYTPSDACPLPSLVVGCGERRRIP